MNTETIGYHAYVHSRGKGERVSLKLKRGG